MPEHGSAASELTTENPDCALSQAGACRCRLAGRSVGVKDSSFNTSPQVTRWRSNLVSERDYSTPCSWVRSVLGHRSTNDQASVLSVKSRLGLHQLPAVHEDFGLMDFLDLPLKTRAVGRLASVAAEET